MPARLVLLSLLAALAVPAVRAQVDGILVVRPVPALTFDAGLGPRLADDALAAEPAPSAAASPTETSRSGPRGRATWRGAGAGFLVGAGISVVGIGVAYVLGGNGDFAAWQLTAAAAVPFTAAATLTGAVVGWTRTGPVRPVGERPR